MPARATRRTPEAGPRQRAVSRAPNVRSLCRSWGPADDSCCGGALAATRPRLSHPQSSPAALRPAALPAPEARPASDHHSVPTTTNEAHGGHGGHGARRLPKLRRCSTGGRASNGDVPRPTHRPHTPRQGILSRDHVPFCDRKCAGVCSPRLFKPDSKCNQKRKKAALARNWLEMARSWRVLWRTPPSFTT